MNWKISAYRFLEKTFDVEGFKNIESKDDYISISFNHLKNDMIVNLGVELKKQNWAFTAFLTSDKVGEIVLIIRKKEKIL